jgi:hypothetical protein
LTFLCLSDIFKLKKTSRVENCVDRVIGYKEQVIEECIKKGGDDKSLDVSKREVRRLKFRRWVDKIFCRNKEFCV